MERIAIVGVSGSGKSTLAAAVAARMRYRHVELDSIHHLPDWEPIETARFREIIAEVAETDGWVIDGNYGSLVQDIIFAAADTIVWLDLPRRVVMPAVTRRTLARMARREELWNGNRERFRKLLDSRPGENIILWSWTSHGPVARRYARLIADPRYVGTSWVRLRFRGAVRAWFESLPSTDS